MAGQQRIPLSAEQRANAATIVTVGRRLGASSRDVLIALMAALQESGLRNLNYGDRDSIGLFQQRNAWGTRAQRLTPAESARMFFQGGHGGQRGLLDIGSRGQLSLTAAAQAVQVSAYPNAYAKWEAQARELLTGTALPSPIPGAKVTTRFGARGSHWESGAHTGDDYAVPVGTKVYATEAGTVTLAGPSGGPYGTRVVVGSPGGYSEIYGHLSATQVRAGTRVTPGQLLGLSGATGNVTGPHLHYEVRQDGKPIDPTTAALTGFHVPSPGDVAGAAGDAARKVLPWLAPAAGALEGDGPLVAGVKGVFNTSGLRDFVVRTAAIGLGATVLVVGIVRATAPAREKATQAAGSAAKLAAVL